MKRHISIIAGAVILFGSAGMAFAASLNESTIEQTANNHTATVTQTHTGGVDINSSVIKQNGGNNNDATVIQNASGANAYIEQKNNVLDSSATIEQHAAAKATITQDNVRTNEASITQYSNAEAVIVQADSVGFNRAIIDQQSGADRSYAEIRQDKSFPQWTSFSDVDATIIQNANDLVAKIQQSSDSFSVSAKISQEAGADSSQAYIDQLNVWRHNTAEITQTSGAAYAYITQTNYADRYNNAAITQNAAGAKATIWQEGIAVHDGDRSERNNAIVTQGAEAEAHIIQKNRSNDNSAVIEQTTASVGSFATVTQENGDENKVSIIQDAPGAKATITQKDGHRNKVQKSDTEETATVNGDITVDQIGSDNILNVSQDSADSTAVISSVGENNLVSLSQSAGANSADISQTGNNNIASLLQTGSNTATISQTGNNFSASLVQSGTGNTAAVTQK